MRLRLSALPHIEMDGGVTVALMPRDAALLAWLAVEGPTPRARICSLLWPGMGAQAASNGLRQRIFRLNRASGAEVLLGAPRLQLATELHHNLASASDLAGVTPLADATEFEAWLQEQKAQRERQDSQALVERVRALEDAGDPGAALALAQTLLERTPLSEPAHRRVMRLLYLLGDRAGALAAFDRCEQLLKHELSTQPAPETLALLARIEAAEPTALAPASRRLPASVLRPPRLVGRERELAALAAAWDAGHVAAVIGEAGMGKSRLLAEFADARPGLVRAAGRPGDAGVPFASLARLLRAVAERHDLSTLAPELSAPLSRVLPELGAADAPPRTDSPRLRLRLRASIARFLGGLQGLLGLLFDDLHFADAASLEMVQALVAESDGDAGAFGSAVATNLRWALGYRPADAGSPLLALQSALSDLAVLEPVHVMPLPLRELAVFVDQLQIGLDGAAIAPQLQQRTGGNPLYVLETLKQAWVLHAGSDLSGPMTLPKPVSVERLIDRRVVQLSPLALALARVASVAGEDFGIGLAEAALGSAAVHLADALNELESAQILKGTQFAHDLVFDAVRRSVPLAIGRHLHAKVAEWLEQHAGEPARVARHWQEAGEPARALSWLQRAADQASAALRNRECIAFLDTKAGIEESLGRVTEAFKTRMAAAAEYETDLSGHDEYVQRCDAIDDLADSDEQRIEAWLLRSSLACHRRDNTLAESSARRALAAAERIGHVALVRSSQMELFEALTIAYRVDEALTLAETLAGWIDTCGEPHWQLNFHANLGMVYERTGRLSAAMKQHARAAELAEALGQSASAVSILGNWATACAQSGQVKLGIEMRRRSLSLSDRHESNARHQGVALTNLAGGLVQRGEYAEALMTCERAQGVLRETVPGGVAMAQAHLALCWLQLGQPGRTMQVVQQMAANPDAIRPARVRMHWLTYLVERARGQARPELLRTALDLMHDGAPAGTHLALRIELAQALAPHDALAALERAREEARQREYAGLVMETHVRAADVAWAVDPARARVHALAALAMADDVDLFFLYRGELWLCASQALLAAGDTGHGERVLAQGLAWLQHTLREHVPTEFRESFRSRNSTNAALFALATRQALSV